MLVCGCFQSHNIDAQEITVSWLTDTIPDSVLDLKGYSIVCCDHYLSSATRQGVVFLVHPNIDYEH